MKEEIISAQKTNRKTHSALAYILTLLLAQRSYGANIIFDLGGVLVDQNYTEALNQFELSKRDYVWYMLTTGNNPRTRLFSLFDVIAPHTDQKYVPCDDHGKTLPALMCEWQRGTRSPEEIRDSILSYCQEHPTLTKSPLEHKIFTHMVTGMFTPEKFAAMQQWNIEGLTFLRSCKAQGHKIYVLSNWDTGSFAVMYQQPYFREIFDLFDGIMISGHEHMTKPDPAYYQHLLDTYQLDPRQSIFIDDQLVNVRAARRVGIHSIWCRPMRSLFKPWSTYPDFAYVRAKFLAKEHVLANQNS